MLSVYCKEDFPQWSDNDDEFVAFKQGKTYIGQSNDGIVMMDSEKDADGKSYGIQFIQSNMPDNFFDIQ